MTSKNLDSDRNKEQKVQKGEKLDKNALVLLCKMAQQTERFQEMVDFIDQIYRLEGELTSQERNLCAAGYKNLVGTKRAELRVLNALETKEDQKVHDKYLQQKCIREFRDTIVSQLIAACKRILTIVDVTVLPRVKSLEEKVFYLKIKGDYNRYLCEFFKQTESSKCLEAASFSYEEADSLSRSNLASTNPIRLGLHLNMAVFCYQILGKYDKALQLANRAFEDAISNIDNVNETDYKDCTFIMQLLRDNITLWSTTEEEES